MVIEKCLNVCFKKTNFLPLLMLLNVGIVFATILVLHNIICDKHIITYMNAFFNNIVIV